MTQTPTLGPLAYANLLFLNHLVRTGGTPAGGICSAVEDDLVETSDWLTDAFVEWPEFSGTKGYPVPPPASFMKGVFSPLADGFYRTYRAYYNLPRWSGRYGASRKRLLAFLVKRAKKERANAPG